MSWLHDKWDPRGCCPYSEIVRGENEPGKSFKRIECWRWRKYCERIGQRYLHSPCAERRECSRVAGRNGTSCCRDVGIQRTAIKSLRRRSDKGRRRCCGVLSWPTISTTLSSTLSFGSPFHSFNLCRFWRLFVCSRFALLKVELFFQLGHESSKVLIASI